MCRRCWAAVGSCGYCGPGGPVGPARLRDPGDRAGDWGPASGVGAGFPAASGASVRPASSERSNPRLLSSGKELIQGGQPRDQSIASPQPALQGFVQWIISDSTKSVFQ